MKLLFLLFLFATLSCSSKSLKEQAMPLCEKNMERKKSYAELKREALDKRESFCQEYKAKKNDKAAQDSILFDAQNYLLTISNDFFTSWYSTPWTFHGHSRIPKEGSIACGYFITTTLQDMGFNIPRIKWAQQASEYLIKKVSTDIKRFHKRPIQEVVEHIKATGEGLYIVGLDCHVGYIYYKDGKMSFVHANYYKPKIGVMAEPLIGHNPLNDSKYRVIGKIFDKEMVKNWVLNTPYTA